MTDAPPHPLFGTAPPEHWPVLARTAQLLLERGLPPDHEWRPEALENVSVLIGEVAPTQEVTADSLDSVMEALTQNRTLSGAPFAVFLAARVQDNTSRRVGNTLSAWILAAALRRLRMTPDQNAIWQGVNSARLLKTRAPQDLQRLTDSLEDPKALLAALNQAAKASELPKILKGYFRALAALMRAAIKLGPATHRERDASGISAGDHLAPLPLQESEADGGVVRISGGFVPERRHFAGPDALQRTDRITPAVTLQGQDDPEGVTPRQLAQSRLRKAARATARRDLSLAAEQDPLSPHEVAILTGWLRDNAEDAAYGPLFADLAFGTAHAKPTGSTWDTVDGQLGLALSVDLPGFESLVETEDVHSEDERLFLPAPPFAVKPVAGAQTSVAVRTTLSALQDKLARSLTRGRIARYKADWLRRAGADAAIVGFLTGQSPGNRSQLHYSCIDQARLLGWHRDYLVKGLGLDLPDWATPAGVYGARLRLPQGFLKIVFDEARKDVRHHRTHGLGGFAEIMAAHNAFLIYTLMVLYLGIGHRPVSCPFEFRSDFDLEAQLLWVSDKTGRGARGARLLPLPARAIKQTRAWITHLEKLQARLRLTHPKLANGALDGALSMDGKAGGPFFLRFDSSGELQPLRPSVQEEAAAPVLPTALNWTRHVLRSALLEACDPAALDAFFGHGHIGEDPFVSGSSLGLSDLVRVADQIEGLMVKCGITVLESPL